MTENRALAPIAIIAAVLYGLYATMSVLLSDRNTIGEFCRYLLVGGFLLSLLQPRLGFHLWLFACGYSDLLKRFLIVGGRMSWDDLPYVLGIAPMMFGGVLVSILLSGIAGARPIKTAHWKLFFLGGFFMVASGVLALIDSPGSKGAVLQSLANNGLYSMLIFVVPVLFADADDFLRTCRFIVWIFVPVALYGVAQQLYGFQDFEIAYLRTGMSIEVKQLFTNRVRAFSTLNSPTALATVCTVLAALSVLLTLSPRQTAERRRLKTWQAVVFTVIFFAGWLASTGRAAIIVIPFAIYGTWAFQKRGRTVSAYVALLTCFVALVLSSRFILDRLDGVNQAIANKMDGSGYGSDMMVVGTYSDRLMGFSDVLANPSAWSWFGKGKEADSFYFHDPLSPVLLRVGGVGLFCIVGMTGALLIWSHRKLQSFIDEELGWLACMFVALANSIILVSLLSGWVLSVFPVNVFFWISWGGAILLVLKDRITEQRLEEPNVTPSVTASARAKHRFIAKTILNSIQ